MFSRNNRSFSCMALILLIFSLVSACGTAGKSSRGNSSIPQMNVIKPCAKQFHPQVTFWSYPMPDVISMAPMIVNNTIYAGSYGNAVYALNAASGKARWIYRTDGRVYVAPTVYQNTVYVGIGDNGPRLFAIDAQSGKLLWHTDTFISSEAQLTIANGLLYTSQGGMLVGLDPQNGKVMWHYNDIQGASLLNDEHILYVE